MIIRKIDAESDWLFGHGFQDYAKDEAAIDENIATRVRSWVGDCFFALQEGVDWRGRLDVGQREALLEEIKAVILGSFGVVAVNSVEAVFSATTRLDRILYNIDTIFSPSFQGEIQQAAGV